MKKKKEGKRLDYKDLFTKPWCPLFGLLPSSENLNDSVIDCINIIKNARSYWGIPPEKLTANSHPKPKDVLNWINKDDLESARLLYMQAWEVYFKSSLYKGYRGHLVPPEKWILQEYQQLAYRGSDLSSEDIYSMIAIWFAREAMQKMLFENKSEEDKSIIIEIKTASSLLAEIKRPDAELGNQVRKNRSRFARIRHEESFRERNKRNTELIDEAKKLKKNKPHLSDRSITNILITKDKELNVKSDHIRKNIIGPALKKMGN